MQKSSAANPEPAARATEQTHESSPNSASQAASETRPGGPKGSTIRPLQPAAPHTAPVNKPQLLTAPTTLHVPQISATTAQQQHADRKSPDEAINTNSPEAVQPAGCANSRIALLPSILLDERVCRRISRECIFQLLTGILNSHASSCPIISFTHLCQRHYMQVPRPLAAACPTTSSSVGWILLPILPTLQTCWLSLLELQTSVPYGARTCRQGGATQSPESSN